MRHLREELQAQIRLAQDAAEKANAKAADALRKLAEETAIADATLADLRKKILSMQKIMEARGLGQIAAECVGEAGLTEFLATEQNVFQRLYRDALDRVQRLSELQARILEKQSFQFMRNVDDFMSPHISLEGLERDDQMIHSNSVESQNFRQIIDNRKSKGSVWDGNTLKSEYPDKKDLPETLGVFGDNPGGPSQPHKGSLRKSGEVWRSSLSPGLSRSQSEELNTDLVLSIASVLPQNLGATDVAGQLRRCSSQVAAAGSAMRQGTRPVATKAPGGLAEGESLPRLECRGQGQSSSNGELEHPLKRSYPSQANLVLAQGSTTSAMQAAKSQGQLFSGSEPLLTIGGLKSLPRSSTCPVLPTVPELPVKPAGKLARPPGFVATRPNAPPGPSPMPRLLMQSVGSIYT